MKSTETPESPPESKTGLYRRQQFFLAPDMIVFLREQSTKLNASQGSIVRASIRNYAKLYHVNLAPERIGTSHKRHYSYY